MDRWWVPGTIKLPFLKQHPEGPWVKYIDAQAEITRLTAEAKCYQMAYDAGVQWKKRAKKAEAERDAALAREAVAYEAAANRAAMADEDDDALDRQCRQIVSEEIRALTTSDARAAHDKAIRQAKVEGLREAANIVSATPEWKFGASWHRSEIAETILAAADKMEAGD